MQDKYILGSMAILCCICVWHAVVPFIYTFVCVVDTITRLDLIAFGVLLAVYIGFHLVQLAVILCLVSHY